MIFKFFRIRKARKKWAALDLKGGLGDTPTKTLLDFVQSLKPQDFEKVPIAVKLGSTIETRFGDVKALLVEFGKFTTCIQRDGDLDTEIFRYLNKDKHQVAFDLFLSPFVTDGKECARHICDLRTTLQRHYDVISGVGYEFLERRSKLFLLEVVQFFNALFKKVG